MLFEMAWAADPPLLVNPELGVSKLTSRTAARSFHSDVTLLDSTDHRLQRSGVVLAHRVVDSLGEWYMDAPAWRPWLPVDCSVALDGAGELPLDFSCLTKPFLRGAPLSPSAALRCESDEVSLLGPGGEPLADVVDARIKVTRSGVTISRAREITLTPRADLSQRLRDWVAIRMIALGATQVDAFPTAQERLGPPAGALPDFPRPGHLNPGATLEGFVTNRLAGSLRQVIEADLAARSMGMHLHSGTAEHLLAHFGEPEAILESRRPEDLSDLGTDPVVHSSMGIHDERHGRIDALRTALGDLAIVVDGLAELLEPRWVRELTVLLDQVLELDPARITIHRMPEGYYRLLDMLVVAVRAPKLVRDGAVPARPVLVSMVRGAVSQVLRLCDKLDVGTDHGWARARRQAEAAAALAATLRVDKRAGKVARRLEKVATMLADTGSVHEGPMPEEIAQLTPAAAFAAGRRLERRLAGIAIARDTFVEKWPDQRAKLLKAVTP
jgi:hypothetical protein